MPSFFQNHPGSRVFPVPLHGRGHDLALLTTLGLIALGLIGVVALVFSFLVFTNPPPAFEDNPTPAILISGVVAGACVFGALLLWQRHKTAPYYEHQRYNALAGHDWLDLDRRAALLLVAPECFGERLWCETLEFEPCEARLTAAASEHERFKTFQVVSKADIQRDLDEWWGFDNADGYRDMILRLFNGMHTTGFEQEMTVAALEHGTELRATLKALHPEFTDAYINECLSDVDGEPPVLIWAFDLWRVIALSRLTFMAGLIEEGEAWKNILKASTMIRAMFTSHEEFQRNWALGRAYWNPDPEISEDSAKSWIAWRDDTVYNWPIRDLPWRTA